MINMNRILKFLALVCLVAGSTSCSKDMIDTQGLPPVVPEGYVRASLDLKVEDNEQVNTRATAAEEDAYDDTNVWVLVFNATSATNPAPTTLVQAPAKCIKSGTKLYALVRATTQPVTLYVVTGLSPALNTYLQTTTNFTEGVTTYATVDTQLQTAAATAAGVPIGSGSYFPMSSDRIAYPTGTTTLTSISKQLTRNVAKIDINASAVSSDFTLEGVTLLNAAQKGFVLAQAAVAANHGGNVQYNENSIVAANKLLSQIYAYENAAMLADGTTPNTTALIIRGKYKGGASSYYRMDIVKDNGNQTYSPHAIRRNCCYTLTIDAIENGGYLTFDEAKANEPSNTKYTVLVTDPDSHDIVNNGHYYLGVSNSEFVIYGDAGQIENLPISTATTDAPTGTHTSISTSAGVTAVTTSLTTPTGAATTTQIHATLASGLTTGYIDLRVGNLTKRIAISREASIVYEDSQKTNFTDPAYKTAEVVSGGDWVHLAATSNADFATSPTTLVNPAGGVYIRYNSMVDMTTRSAELYIARADDRGRAKVLLFPTAITYVSSTLPDNVDKHGKDATSTSVFNATFLNPGNYPFKVGVSTGSTALMEMPSNILTVKQLDLDAVRVTDPSVSLPRPLTLTYCVNGVWYNTTRNFQQREQFTVRILSVGGHALRLNTGPNNGYGVQLGRGIPADRYANGISALFGAHTGVGKPVSNKFDLYNLSMGGENGGNIWNNLSSPIGQILRDNNIDILFCSINQTNGSMHLSEAQATEILDWLAENPYRGLIFVTDYADNGNLTKALFGVPQTTGSGTAPYSKLLPTDPYYENSVYKAIMQGSYSTDPALHSANPIDLRTTNFTNTTTGINAYGGVPLDLVKNSGFIPIFYVKIGTGDYVLFTVHPTRNIVMMGDINWFDTQFLNPNGSLDPKGYGNYPKMVMNMWEWYINNVALGKGQ